MKQAIRSALHALCLLTIALGAAGVAFAQASEPEDPLESMPPSPWTLCRLG